MWNDMYSCRITQKKNKVTLTERLQDEGFRIDKKHYNYSLKVFVYDKAEQLNV